MRLKALLIDDEINILRNLQMVLPWEEHDVEIIGLAKNGVQALEMVHEHHPHLIFCDIRMPVMDGIEFLHSLREFDEQVEVIMLTGYQDFEYARSVLRYRVIDYVLKPIDYDALEVLFVKVISNIRQTILLHIQADEEQVRVKDIAYEKVLLDLLNGFYDASHMQKRDVTFRLAEQQYALLVIENLNPNMNLPHSEQLSDQMTSYIKHSFNYDVVCHMIHVEIGFWGLIVVGQIEDIEEQQLLLLMEFWQGKLLELGELHYIIGAYEKAVQADQIHQTWKRLCKEISFANQSSMLVREAEPTLDGNAQHVWLSTERLISAIKHMDHVLAKQCLEELNMQFKHLSEESLQQVEKLANSIVVYMIKELRRFDAVSEGYEQQIWDQLKGTRKLKEIIDLANAMVEEAFMTHSSKRPQVSIHTAAQYIESHLSYDLAAEEVANYLNISLSYFSTIFKQYYGVTFIEFVTQARIERAKSMLTKTQKSLSDIAKAVGYTERRYFNKVFQKRVGMLPSEFREQMTIRNEVS